MQLVPWLLVYGVAPGAPELNSAASDGRLEDRQGWQTYGRSFGSSVNVIGGGKGGRI